MAPTQVQSIPAAAFLEEKGKEREEPSDSSQALLVSELQIREPPARAFLFSSYQKDTRLEAGRMARGFLLGSGAVCATEPALL